MGTCVVLSFEAMPGLCCFLRLTHLHTCSQVPYLMEPHEPARSRAVCKNVIGIHHCVKKFVHTHSQNVPATSQQPSHVPIPVHQLLGPLTRLCAQPVQRSQVVRCLPHNMHKACTRCGISLFPSRWCIGNNVKQHVWCSGCCLTAADTIEYLAATLGGRWGARIYQKDGRRCVLGC